MRIDAENSDTKKGILPSSLDKKLYLSPSKQMQPGEPISFYYCILPPEKIAIQKLDSDQDMVMVRVVPEQ